MENTAGDTDTAAANGQKKSKKPANTAFKQQRLPAWQPVMTAKTVIPAFFVIGVIFIPLGAVLYTTSQSVNEKIIDYTDRDDCKSCYDNLTTDTAHAASYVPCQCSINFTLDTSFEGTVYMYYGLDNFYQNHRRYVKSRDDTQLLGEVRTVDGSNSLNSDCAPYRVNNDSMMYAPCGAIANSLFNDTLWLTYDGNPVPLLKKGIAWITDKQAKFKNPTDTTDLCKSKAFENTVKPANWPKPVCELDLNDPENNGYQNEDLIVWMRNAALPNFRKLYRIIDSTGDFENGLPAGDYTLNVLYNYPVKSFEGRKKMVLSTVSWMGGKNPFLGIAYMVVGIICVLLAIVFIIIHFRIGKSNEQMTDVTNRTPYM